MKKVRGQGRDNVYVQHPQATPAYITLLVMYNLYWTSLNQSECICNAKLKHSYPNGQFLQTPHVGICMQVWLVHVAWDIYIWWSFLNTPHPYLVPILFSPVHSYIFLDFSNFFNVLVHSLSWWPLAIFNYFICHHQHQHSFLHLHNFVYLVFNFRHITKSERGKLPAQLQHWTVVQQ